MLQGCLITKESILLSELCEKYVYTWMKKNKLYYNMVLWIIFKNISLLLVDACEIDKNWEGM